MSWSDAIITSIPETEVINPMTVARVEYGIFKNLFSFCMVVNFA
jgi:hypothetical protein